MSYPEFLIDRRVVQRNIAKGVVDAKQYEKLLSDLPDVSSNAEVLAAHSSPPPSSAAHGADDDDDSDDDGDED